MFIDGLSACTFGTPLRRSTLTVLTMRMPMQIIYKCLYTCLYMSILRLDELADLRDACIDHGIVGSRLHFIHSAAEEKAESSLTHTPGGERLSLGREVARG